LTHHHDDFGPGRNHQHQHHGWRKFEAMGRRGFGGWSGPRGFGSGGMGGDWGDSFRIGRMLASGDLRLIALYLIEQQPRHGYDLIKAIEEKTGGIYVPSPGVVYPALTFLEEAGYVTSVAEANKRLYTITDEGRTHLADNRTAVETTLAHLARIGEQFAKVRAHWEQAERGFTGAPPRPDRDMDDVEPAVNEARKELKAAIKEAAQNRDPANQQRLAGILRRAAEEIRRHEAGGRVDSEIDI
jgi:DNA-binding PadR family transcriptional regulator